MAKAHIRGYCPKCGFHVAVGDEIQYSRRGEYAGIRMHPVCYRAVTDGYRLEESSITKYREVRTQVIAELNGIEKPQPQPQSADDPPTPAPITGDSLTQAIVNAIWPHIDGKLATAVDTAQFKSEIEGYRAETAAYVVEVVDALRKEVKATTTGVQRIEFSTPAVPSIIMDTPHPLLPKLIRALQLGQIPYLHSGAGAGKTHAALDAAVILGYAAEETYVITCNPFSSPIELTGYTDAHGKLVDKAFSRAFRDGGFVVLDEADRARPDFLPALNSALANGQMVAPDGTCIAKHVRFMLVLTGNTSMRGADRQYNSASKQDGSVIDRLFYMHWTYDEALERSICLQMSEHANLWVDWVHTIRAYVGQNAATCTDLLVTMRACIQGLRLLCDHEAVFGPEEIVDAIIMRGIAEDTRKRVLQAYPLPKGLAKIRLPKPKAIAAAEVAA